MDILHISDLHLTPPFRSLHEVWLGPAAHVRPKSFDFIVVSGDLSQRARTDEYDQLLAFAVERLIPLLRKEARERIVFVPGNHDVNWAHPIGSSSGLASISAENIRSMLSECRNDPTNARRRLHIGSLGHLEVIELNEPAE